MIDLFEINTSDLANSRYKRFVSKTLDNTKFQEKIEKADKDFKQAVDKIIAPKQKWINILYYVSLITCFLTLIFLLLVIQNIDIKENKIPVNYIVFAGVSLVCVIVSSLLQKKAKQKLDLVMKSDEIKKVTEKNKEIEGLLVKDLGIPEGTGKIDVFVRHVYVRNGDYYNALKQSYSNYALYAYFKNNKVSFSDTYEVIEFSLDEVIKVRYVKEKITFDHWNKKDYIRDEKYKEYKLRFSGRGGLIMTGFYQIDIERDGRKCMLRLPGYEKEFVESIFNKDDIVIEEKYHEDK
jgi:hypothetical protein